MRKSKVLAAIAILILGFGIWILISQGSPSYAIDPVDELQGQINELANLKKLSEDATKPLEQELKNLDTRIKNAEASIARAKKQASDLAASIEKREKELAVQYQILSRRIGEQYKRSRTASPFLIFLSSADATRLTQDLAYRDSIKAQDKRIIEDMGGDITQLEKDKAKQESDQVRLAALEKQLEEQAGFFEKEIAKARSYQQELSGKIAALSAQQQSIINARSGTFITSVGEVPLADDFNASIGFKSQAPGNSFAVFSFGAYTHRKGMSQYGARARAEAGQSVEEILKAYYPDATLKKDYSAMGEIDVQGHGRMSFEDRYLQGIYEMPGGWHSNALKAQAIAARTYAIKYTDNGKKSICTTEACQVFKNSKKGGEWEKAVNETKGWVLVDGGGNPVSTQYASTHGGYATTSGWDTTDKSNSGDWSSRSWENKAKSPWFYKSWYRQAYSSSSSSCGRPHPWLSQEEFSDIINAWIVRKNPNGADVSRIQPVTINQCNVGGSGGNPYSMEELRNLANGSGGAVTSVSSVSVSHNGSAQTDTVTLQTNRGEIKIPGSEFKSTFNLRAPGYISIPQSSFAFFNIEKT
ncbi:MAG TPA: SpoIID/LytB domain-containing protein [Vitreimonas sp.]|nr:SpoIID/LytB domain-containing protein [Vitreimonas sp.]